MIVTLFSKVLSYAIYRVEGVSMCPTLPPGSLILATKHGRAFRVGDIVVINHDHVLKVKRITAIKRGGYYVIGDNLSWSTDSRHFGVLSSESVVARVCLTPIIRRRRSYIPTKL